MVRLFFIALLFLFCACVSDVVPERMSLADNIAVGANMHRSVIKTNGFAIMSYSKITRPGEAVTIYIEGDGFAWASANRLSSNPTPRDPMVLRLASLDDSANVVYLARPCQYISFAEDGLCEPKFWSGSRFSDLVIKSMNQAVGEVVKKAGSSGINLVGYSGGAAVATIIAAQRKDVISIRTVAGNLDHDAINKYHHVDLLDDSLNAIDFARKVSDIPQNHFFGSEDRVVPAFIAKNFAMQAGNSRGCVRVNSVDAADHHKGWEKQWRNLLAKPLICDSEMTEHG